VRRKVSAVCHDDYWNHWAKDVHINDKWKVWRHMSSLGWKGLSSSLTSWKYLSMLDGVLVLKYYHRFEYYLSSVVMTGPFSNSVSPQIIISRIQDGKLVRHNLSFISFRRILLPLQPLKNCLWEYWLCTACSNSLYSYFSSIDYLSSSVRIKCTEWRNLYGLLLFCTSISHKPRTSESGTGICWIPLNLRKKSVCYSDCLHSH
jgi:hypothetical protein